ncbi:hypothetical protein AAC387_Pa06g0364 [Persea americana]
MIYRVKVNSQLPLHQVRSAHSVAVGQQYLSTGALLFRHPFPDFKFVLVLQWMKTKQKPSQIPSPSVCVRGRLARSGSIDNERSHLVINKFSRRSPDKQVLPQKP